MKVPYQLRWLPASVPATALLLSGHRADEVLRVCVELGLDPLPSIYAVADGFLLLLPRPSEKQVVGAIRLRGLSDHLLIPVNAELVPRLLADESAALVRKRGLVFLPGGRVLEFDPERPIPLSALVRLGPTQHRPWQALPAPPPLAEEITEITQVGVDTTAEQIIEQGGAGIGTEDPTLEGGGLPSQIAGKTMFQLGKTLAWLGQKMNSPKLTGLGAKLLGGAMSLVPSLSEKLMGAQEAMLRELLRQFRAGNIEKALKHAMPLGADPARGMTPAQNAQLPSHNLFYSLLNLLGSAGAGGPASMWMTSDQTYRELLSEYRKQADLAVSRGDFRRAAFIHAKLLHDFHSAARVLAQGGLHRDAAVLYEKKLGDLVSAAKEWQAAGEIDRAIHLYRKMGDYAMAGDLLHLIGEEDRAVQEYQLAAAKLLDSGQHYEAGELLRVRGQRPDLARDYYEKGWQLRPAGSAMSCATRLVQQHAAGAEGGPFLSVLAEAEEYLVGHDPESTATFFTEIARLAKTPPLAPIADEAQDRALLGIAKKMRQHLTTSPSYVRSLANLVKDPSVWPVPLVGDAQHALNEASNRPTRARTAYHTVQARCSNVTAVCQMPLGHQVFLGFENGEVVIFEPAGNGVHLLTHENGPILSLVVDASRAHLLVLSQTGPDKVCLRALSPNLDHRMIAYHHELVSGPARLAVPALNCHAKYTLLFHGNEYRYFTLPNLIGLQSFQMDHADEIADVVVHGTFDQRQSSWWVLAFVEGRAKLLPDCVQGGQGLLLGWVPGINEASTLMQVPLQAVLLDAGTLEIAGLDVRGTMYRTTLRFQGSVADIVHFHPIGGERYRAFACVRGDLMAGVHVHGIDWWTPGRVRPVETKLAVKNPVAAFALPDARELLIIDADGLLTRVPVAE